MGEEKKDPTRYGVRKTQNHFGFDLSKKPGGKTLWARVKKRWHEEKIKKWGEQKKWASIPTTFIFDGWEGRGERVGG